MSEGCRRDDNLKDVTSFLTCLASKALDRLLALLATTDHARAVPLYDAVMKDLSSAAPILNEILLTASNHDDPQLHTPHGLLTAVAARDLLKLTRPPGGLALHRFVFLYNFTLPKRALSPGDADTAAKAVPSASRGELEAAYRKAVHGGLAGQATGLLCRIAVDHGLDGAGHAALRASLDDIGRLGHNLVMAVAYLEAAESQPPPKNLVPLANLAALQARGVSETAEAAIAERLEPPKAEPDLALLGRLVEDGEFDRVEAVLQALALEGRAEEAYRPLLIAASADPGFLGHTLSLALAARKAVRYLEPAENAWLAWKLYRTLTTRFGYPEFLRLGVGEPLDRDSVLTALDASLRYKTPPAERTVRQALESEVSLDDVLARIVDAYGGWTVGEKEHTIIYLNAALQTAKVLGRDEALLPLTFALSKLPF